MYVSKSMPKGRCPGRESERESVGGREARRGGTGPRGGVDEKRGGGELVVGSEADVDAHTRCTMKGSMLWKDKGRFRGSGMFVSPCLGRICQASTVAARAWPYRTSIFRLKLFWIRKARDEG
jgi:hypothetical protein